MEKLNTLKPSFYNKFQCKGGACIHSCCQGWNISMTKEEYRKWKKKGVLSREQWKDCIMLIPDEQRTEFNYAIFKLKEDKTCPLWGEDGLCQVQKNHGADVMTNTCMVYPRQFQRYFDHVECSMSLSCERVLELLLEEKDGILLEQSVETYPERFLCASWYKQQERRRYPHLRGYYDIQTLCMALLQAEDISMEGRLLLLGMALNHIDGLYKEQKGDLVPAYIQEYLDKVENSDVEAMLRELTPGNPLASYNSVLTTLMRMNAHNEPALVKIRAQILERIQPPKELAQEKGESLEQWKAECYRKCMGEFEEWIKGKEYFLENVMVDYLFFSNIPYRDIEKSIWENYLYFVWIYMMLKISLCAYLHPDSTDQDMIYCCTVLFRTLAHNKKMFYQILEDFKADGDTVAHVAILLKNLKCSDDLSAMDK